MAIVYIVSFALAFLCTFAFAKAETTARKLVCWVAWLIVTLGLLIYLGSIFIAAITIKIALFLGLGTISGLVVGSLFKKN